MCPKSTPSSLVGRGLAKFRKRLKGTDALALAVAGTAVFPPGLARATARAGIVFRTHFATAAVSPAVADLTEGVLRTFRLKDWAAGLAADGSSIPDTPAESVRIQHGTGDLSIY